MKTLRLVFDFLSISIVWNYLDVFKRETPNKVRLFLILYKLFIDTDFDCIPLVRLFFIFVACELLHIEFVLSFVPHSENISRLLLLIDLTLTR